MVAHFIVLLGTLKNKKYMQTINVIDNVFLKDGILHAFGREEEKTMVFLKQGDLLGGCAVYSLMMMLIIHKRINLEDLLHKVSSKAPTYIKELKKRFLLSAKRRYSLTDLKKKLLLSFNNQIPVDEFLIRNFNGDEFRKLHLKIKEHLDTGWPVLISFIPLGVKIGHCVVAVGYTLFGTTLRLFCLDSAFDLQYATIWNNVIDINMDYDDLYKLDFYYMANEVVIVKSILLINDKLDLPFEPEDKDSILPF